MEFTVFTIESKGMFNSGYNIYQDDNFVYSVIKPSIFISRKRIIKDSKGQELVTLHRKLNLGNFKIDILENDQIIATIVKETFSNKYHIDGTYGVYEMNGNFFNSELTIFNGNSEVAKISKKRKGLSSIYGVAIKEGNNKVFLLSIVLAFLMVAEVQHQG
ncbi:MAG: LURP-one-related family protein [Saprospiraceae bacterium]